MFIVGMLSWWYTDGWRRRVVWARNRLISSYDYFSIDLLARTLFSPWRQISAGKVQGPIGVQLRAWFDNLISRIIGGFVRTLVMIIGIVTILVTVVVCGVVVITWAFVPFAPFIALGLTMAGVAWQI